MRFSAQLSGLSAPFYSSFPKTVAETEGGPSTASFIRPTFRDH